MQCFAVWSDEIEGRLDPYYVKSISKIKNIKTNYPIVTLSSLLKEPPQYGANESATDGNPKTDVRYIRITDIDEFGNLKNDDWKTTTNINEKYLLKEKDILFARSGATAGKTFIFDKSIGKAIFAGYLIRFRIDETKANPWFVFYYTQLKRYNYWLKLIQRPSGQPNINAEEFKSFEIPLPPLSIQNQIVDIMQSVFAQKNQMEAEAQKLLDSIDSYVLDELGIKLPEVEDKMCFAVSSDEVQNNRVDAYYYQPKFEDVDRALNHVGYKEFKELLEIITKGETPLWRGDLYLSQGIPFLKVQNISQEGIKGELTYISEEVHNRMKRSQLNGGELLYTMAGTIGIAAIFPEDLGVANINQAIAKIILKKDTNKEFIKCVLNSNICRLQTQRFLTTSAQPNINFEQIKSLKIPFPPLEIQNKIAEEVKRRISEAERLKAEATKILEEAKKQVEGMILGE
jgi:restriction endonuclease S subunit